jgi:hypothetical protein
MTEHGDGYDQERAAVGALFTEEGRRDPHGVLAALDLPTARFAVVEHVLRDPAFLRAGRRARLRCGGCSRAGSSR